MDEQIDRALEDLVAEKQELQQKVESLQQQLHEQRVQFLQEKHWRIRFNMTVLQYDKQQVEQELASLTNQQSMADT